MCTDLLLSRNHDVSLFMPGPVIQSWVIQSRCKVLLILHLQLGDFLL